MTAMAMGLNMENLGNLDSEVEITPTDANSLPKKVKKNSAINSTYVKPLAIVGGIMVVGITVATVKLATPEAEVRTADGGQASTIIVDDLKTGANELNVSQAQYISDMQLDEAEKSAREGVTTAAIVNRAKVSSSGVSFTSSPDTDLSAVTANYKSVPRTVAELEAANTASGNTLYTQTNDDDGNIIYINKRTKDVIYPIDIATLSNQNAQPTDSNATMATNYSDGGNGGNGGNSGDGSGSGGQGGGSNNPNGAGASNDPNQNQGPRPTGAEPLINSRREVLNADYLNQQAQREAMQAQTAEYNKQRQDQFQQRQDYRRESASSSLGDAIAQVKNSTQSRQRSGYNPVSYTQPQNQGQQGGFNNNSNNGNNNSQSQDGSYGMGLGGNQGQNQGYQGQNQGYSQPNSQQGAYLNEPPTGLAPMPQDVQMSQGGQPYGVPNSPYQVNNFNQGGSYGVPSPYAPQYANNFNPTNPMQPQVNNDSQGLILDQRLPANVIRAGTKWQAVVTKSVNTDEGLQVIGELVTGKYAGSTVYGVIEQSGRDVGVRFTSVAPSNPRKPLMPISAYATTIGGQKTSVSTARTSHYFQNYGIMGLTSILRGVGSAYENSGETSVITDSGNVITTTESEPSSKKIRGEVLGELGTQLTDDIAKLGSRAPTYKVAIGTVLNVVLSSDLDVNQTSSSLGNAANSTLGGSRSTTNQ